MIKPALLILLAIGVLIGIAKPAVEKYVQQTNDQSALVTSTESTANSTDSASDRSKPTTESVMEKKQYSQAPAMQINPAKQYQAKLKTTEGEIVIDLNAKNTPITVNNFVFLAKEGFYNDTIFHRAIQGFMIQGGDPLGSGMGGPGYRFEDEPFTGQYTRGTVAMANAGPDTNGSQFFIMHQDYPLPQNYVIFGQVSQGLEILDEIASAPVTQSASGEKSKPINPVTVQSIEITEK